MALLLPRFSATDSSFPHSEYEQIARLAHRIYEEEGREEGKAAEHWARTERVVREQRMPALTADREGVSPAALQPPSQMVP